VSSSHGSELWPDGSRVVSDALSEAEIQRAGIDARAKVARPTFHVGGQQQFLDSRLRAPSYRAFSQNWTGHPAELPAATARHHTRGGATVYASWNGATQVTSWTVFAGKTQSSLAQIASARRAGFETAIAVPSAGPYFAVQPHDAARRPLSRSAPIRIA
jgi:hypothetical protein